MNNGIFLGLGSNVGDRLSNLQNAISLLGLQIVNASSIYETEPVDYTDQPWFLNQVIKVSTKENANQLLLRCRKIENRLGRTREIEKGPRTIDIDLLFFNDSVIQNELLTVPHPAIQNRRFVLEPLNEIDPDFIHPVLGLSVADLLEQCPDLSEVRRIEPM